MVELAGSLRCLVTVNIEREDGRAVIEIPHQEVEQQTLDTDETYQIAILNQATTDSVAEFRGNSSVTNRDSMDESERQMTSDESAQTQSPPVSEGEIRTVTIETVGDQGDGIAKVERGYVIIVPNTTPGDDLRIQIQTVRENVAFAQKLNNQ